MGASPDICQTGFVDGPLVIPNFVLEELRHIADSSDALKRIRGRRGLDILNKIRRELTIEVQISNEDFPDINEVDDKLVRLAQDMCGCVITNDFNLNKVAELKGVTVLNINELANAIKPVVLPGEEMVVTVVKEGKELNQGVAYLDDGTMIVVENGRNYMNETIHVAVTKRHSDQRGTYDFCSSARLIKNLSRNLERFFCAQKPIRGWAFALFQVQFILQNIIRPDQSTAPIPPKAANY